MPRKHPARVPVRTAATLVSAAAVLGLIVGVVFVKLAVNPGREAAAQATQGDPQDSAGSTAAPASAEAAAAASASNAAAADDNDAGASDASVDAASDGLDGAVPDGAASAGDAGETEPTAAAPDESELHDNEGWLTVRFESDADVWVHGKKVGRTNKPIKLECGQRWTRVGKDFHPGFGKPPRPQWLSAGNSVVIECGKASEARFDAIEPPKK